MSTRTERTVALRARIDALPAATLRAIVHTVVDELYQVAAEGGEASDPLDPEKEWNSDTAYNIAQQLDYYKLRP